MENTKPNFFTWDYPRETQFITEYEKNLECHGEYKNHPQFYRASDFIEGKKIGTFGDVSVYSASSVKTLDTYGGGLAVTDDSVQAKSLFEHQGRLNQTPRMVLVKKVVTDLIRNLVTQPVVFSFVA